MPSTFISTGPVTATEALGFADQLDAALEQVANGELKPSKLPIEPIARLIQFTRDNAVPDVPNWKSSEPELEVFLHLSQLRVTAANKQLREVEQMLANHKSTFRPGDIIEWSRGPARIKGRVTRVVAYPINSVSSGTVILPQWKVRIIRKDNTESKNETLVRNRSNPTLLQRAPDPVHA